ncbi:hypothetical protein SLEP1_g58851 [Rubroshorea leprosula]|uniref:Uncharacterized protein n=1 Tax=Rubroshorea leprosula TaxID=152421 RepID=A0AAV5MTW9_9ROSI|nr:hypothetical protein SLEP1_g58851 [Rubroshorea leprosula]
MLPLSLNTLSPRLLNRKPDASIASKGHLSTGQLYVALSRVKSKHGLKILSLDIQGNVSKQTTNIVFKEAFQRLH